MFLGVERVQSLSLRWMLWSSAFYSSGTGIQWLEIGSSLTCSTASLISGGRMRDCYTLCSMDRLRTIDSDLYAKCSLLPSSILICSDSSPRLSKLLLKDCLGLLFNECYRSVSMRRGTDSASFFACKFLFCEGLGLPSMMDSSRSELCSCRTAGGSVFQRRRDRYRGYLWVCSMCYVWQELMLKDNGSSRLRRQIDLFSKLFLLTLRESWYSLGARKTGVTAISLGRGWSDSMRCGSTSLMMLELSRTCPERLRFRSCLELLGK